VKTIRFWLFVLGTAVAVAALSLAVALLPAVQRRVVLWIASGQPGLTLDVDYVAIGPGAAELRGLHLQKAGVQVAVAEASFDLSWWEAVVHRRLILHHARVTGMKVDLTRSAGSTGASLGGASPLPRSPTVPGIIPPPVAEPDGAPPHPAFTGVLDHLHLPCEVVLDACEVEADIVFPRTAGKLPGGAQVKLTGGHFGPRRDAEFDFDATIRNPDAGAPVDEVTARGAWTATLNGQSVIERAGIHVEAVARGPLVPAAARLQADVVLARTPAGEAYSVALNSIEGGVVSRLLNLDGDYVAGSSTLVGSWQVLANHRQVTAFALGFAVPEFSVSGDGRFEVNFAGKNLQLAGRLSGNASRLDFVDPRLREINGLGATGTFDLRYDRRQLRVADLTVQIAAGKPVLSVRAVQAFTVDLATGDIAPSGSLRELVHINLDGVPVNWIRSFFPGIELSGDEIEGELVAALHGAGRVWLRTISPLSVHGLALSQGGRIVLRARDVRLDAEVEHSREGTGVQLTKLSVATATGDQLDGRGVLTVKPGGDISAQASFDASLPSGSRSCLVAGPMIAHGSVALAESGGIIQVDRVEAHLSTIGGRPLVDLTSPGGFRIDPRRRQITTLTGIPGEVLRVKYGRIPLDVWKPCPDFLELKGELIAGELVLRAEGEGLRLAGVAPLRLENVSATGGGMTWLKDLVVETDPTIDYSAHGATARMAELRVMNLNGAVLLSAQANVTVDSDLTNPKFQGTTSFDLAVPVLAGQPLMGGVEAPRLGKLTGNVNFSFDHDLLGEGRLTLSGLVSPTTGEALPVANLSFRAGLNDQGEIAVQAPVLVDRAGQRSDLTLAATLRPTVAGRTIDGRITGEHFAVDDVLFLLQAFWPRKGTPAGALCISSVPPQVLLSPRLTEAESTALVVPGWKGLTGQVQLDVKSVVYGRLPEVLDLKGRLVIEPQRLALENVAARLGTEAGQLQLDGEVRCNADDPQPYQTSFDLEVKEFDLGSIFKAMDPGKPPTVEGRFDVHGQAKGAGRTLGELLRQTRGDLVLQSRKGVSRLLDRPPPPPPRSTGIVSGVTNTAARLIDNLGEKVGKMVSYTDPTDEIAGMLGEVSFDQLSVRVSRDPAANLWLTEFTLVSPILRLQGEGVVTPEADKSWFNRPLKLTLSLGVMGTVEKAMTQAKAPMLSTNRDDLGYLKSTDPFDVVGTLDQPDPGQLYTMVARSMLGKLLH
jgi:hypothetical protein